jgi:hypothetical protein
MRLILRYYSNDDTSKETAIKPYVPYGCRYWLEGQDINAGLIIDEATLRSVYSTYPMAMKEMASTPVPDQPGQWETMIAINLTL